MGVRRVERRIVSTRESRVNHARISRESRVPTEPHPSFGTTKGVLGGSTVTLVCSLPVTPSVVIKEGSATERVARARPIRVGGTRRRAHLRGRIWYERPVQPCHRISAHPFWYYYIG